MPRHFRIPSLLIALLLLVFLAPAHGDDKAKAKETDKKPAEKKVEAPKYLRLQRDEDKNPTAMETAIVRFVPAGGEKGVEVELIGVVHIADKAYYKKLNKRFEQYDAMLYEMVGPQGVKPEKGKGADNPIAFLQKLGKVVLDLDLQTDVIDYNKKNFVHADLSPEEMAEAMKKRGDDGLTVTLGAVADILRQQNLQEQKQKEKKEKEKDGAKPKEEEFDFFALLADPEGAVKMKRMMAEQFENLEGGLGPTLNNILITDRNAAAAKVLQKEIAKGKKKIAIFYGAAHMPDFEKRLKDDFGLKRDKEEWLKAWDLKEGKERGLEDLLKLLAP